MEKEFVPYEIALELKELGFDEPCFGEYRQWDGSRPYLQLYQDIDGCSTDPADFEYTTECKVPTFSQAFRWFREKYQLDSWIYPNLNGLYYISIIRRGVGLGKLYEHQIFEEAELACLKKLIEIVKNK